MGLMKELNALNDIYQNMYAEDENKGYVVTRADKKGNTPAWQGYKAGKKKKDGKPMYRAADHLKNESVGSAVDKTLSAVGDVAKVGAKAAVGTAKGAAGAVKVASKVVKGVGKAAGRVVGTPVGAVKAIKKGYKSAANDESFEISPEVEKLIESGKFTEQEIEALIEAERKLADRLARKRKVYDKTTKKAMQFARDEGEASGHARFNMSRLGREKDKLAAKRREANEAYDNTKSPYYDKKKKALAKKHGGADKVKGHPQYESTVQTALDSLDSIPAKKN